MLITCSGFIVFGLKQCNEQLFQDLWIRFDVKLKQLMNVQIWECETSSAVFVVVLNESDELIKIFCKSCNFSFGELDLIEAFDERDSVFSSI